MGLKPILTKQNKFRHIGAETYFNQLKQIWHIWADTHFNKQNKYDIMGLKPILAKWIWHYGADTHFNKTKQILKENKQLSECSSEDSWANHPVISVKIKRSWQLCFLEPFSHKNYPRLDLPSSPYLTDFILRHVDNLKM